MHKVPPRKEATMLFDGLSVRGRSRRNLASAFIGEIAAAMDSVEGNTEIRRLELSRANANELHPDFSEFQLPRLVVYEANVSQLDLFNAPLPRELSYFYTRLSAIPARLRALKPSAISSAEDIKQRTQDALDDIDQTMILGENLLRSIGGFVSHKRLKSISRA